MAEGVVLEIVLEIARCSLYGVVRSRQYVPLGLLVGCLHLLQALLHMLGAVGGCAAEVVHLGLDGVRLGRAAAGQVARAGGR